VHYIDPHFPYVPPAPFADRFQNDEHWQPEPKVNVSTTQRKRQMTGIGFTQQLDNRDELAFYVARYDAEIAYSDQEIGRLLSGLETRGLADGRLTVVTADHGESLGEHYYYFDHGRFSFQTCLRVPLIFHFPEILEPRVDTEAVPLIDIAPTLLDFANILSATAEGRKPTAASKAENQDADLPGRWMSGHSLRARFAASEPTSRVVFSEAGYAQAGAWQRVATDGRFKLIFARSAQAQRWLDGPGVQRVLYDLEADPGETTNVAADHPEDFDRLDSALRRWLSSENILEVQAREADAMDEETRRQLEALGYL
jgi:arylsulfatase A-like enzyme